MSNLIEARGVSRTFAAGRGGLGKKRVIRAVDDIDIAVGQGEVLGLVGESGSGKSTLGKMLLGLIRPDSGTIRVAGTVISGIDRRALARRIQPVFQDPYSSLNPRKTLASIVALPLAVLCIGNARERRAKAIDMLARVGLPARHADVYPNELSGGQRQRVAIARALVNNPSILLADEPTGNLDSKTGIEIMGLFEKLHKAGNTIVLVTHEPDVAAYAYRSIHIRDGQVENDVRRAA
jgi:peptide/nickel transport system ATP-binding protein